MSSSAVVIESAGPRSSSTGIISGGARHRSSTQALIAYKNQPGPKDILVVDEWRSLPALVELPPILRTVLKHAPFSSNEKDCVFWHNELTSKEFQDLLADAFYMILGHIVQKSSSSIRSSNGILSLDKSPHFCRMANCYVKMIKRMNVRDLPSFMGYFELVLACAVVLCFKTSFPLHPDMFCCVSFVHRVLDLCTEWVRGFNPAEPKCPQQQKKGAFIYQCVHAANDPDPDLSLLIGTMVGGRKDNEQQQHHQQHRHRRNKADAAYKVAILIRRVSYKLQHSALIKCYMIQHSGKEYPQLASYMRWSEEPSRPVKTVAVSDMDRRRMKQRNAAHGEEPRLRRLPNVPREVNKVAEFRKNISRKLADVKEVHRLEVQRIYKGQIELPNIEPLTKEMEALIQANDAHALSDYIITHKKRPPTLSALRKLSLSRKPTSTTAGFAADDLIPV